MAEQESSGEVYPSVCGGRVAVSCWARDRGSCEELGNQLLCLLARSKMLELDPVLLLQPVSCFKIADCKRTLRWFHHHYLLCKKTLARVTQATVNEGAGNCCQWRGWLVTCIWEGESKYFWTELAAWVAHSSAASVQVQQSKTLRGRSSAAVFVLCWHAISASLVHFGFKLLFPCLKQLSLIDWPAKPACLDKGAGWSDQVGSIPPQLMMWHNQT